MDWLCFFIMVAIEVWGDIYFFDSFSSCKWKSKKVIRYPLFFIVLTAASLVSTAFSLKYGEILKYFVVLICEIILCLLIYDVGYIGSIFLGTMNYILLLMLDFTFVWITGNANSTIMRIVWIFYRIIWMIMLVLIRRRLSGLRKYLIKRDGYWKRNVWLPFITAGIGFYFMIYMTFKGDHNYFYSVISGGLVVLNIVSMHILLYLSEKDEKLKSVELQIQKKQNQLQVFHDMQSLYERQGKKLHDYKKQLITVQGLIENGNSEAAIHLTKELTKSIAVEMSEINSGHPVVNAVLNQEYRIAKGKGIGMILSVTDADKIRLNDEDIVVLFGNLLDNAIHECEKIVKSGACAVIRVKLTYMDGDMIITVRNPVLKQVYITNNDIVNQSPEGHGIGLVNIRETIEKYGGNFIISCDEQEFTAVAVI